MNLAKIIILEGPDGSGKTTLANNLRDRHGYQIVKTGSPQPGESVFHSYTNTLLDAVNSNHRTVFDRHYLGELIYGPLLRGCDQLGLQGRDLVERLIAARGVALVICVPPWSTLVKGWEVKDDLLKRQDQLRTVNAAYVQEAKRLGLKIYNWVTGHPPPIEPRPLLPIEVTGYPQADTLWVGERAGKARLVWDLPFHNVTGSARYLWETLQNVDEWRERRGAWTNAFNAIGRPRNLAAIVETLPKLKRVIALGDVAKRECGRQGVMTNDVPHPAFWRRFHHHDQTKYQALLEDALSHDTQ